ncbi:RnfABCDGE type electron transport complex subunit D [bacterium]|nr:RnfABCDGE type electron transport complex subunit D [bacterium]
MKVLDRLLGFRDTRLPLSTDSLPITDLTLPSRLSISYNCLVGTSYSPLVELGEEIESGQSIWEIDAKHVYPSPVKGKVVNLANVPDIRADRMVPSLIIEPIPETSPKALPPLNQDKESVSTLKKRVEEAGILTNQFIPSPLIDGLCPTNPLKAVVVLAIDREPGISAFVQLFRERSKDAVSAATLLGKISGAQKVFLAVHPSLVEKATDSCQQDNISVLTISPEYPESLDSLVVEKTGFQKDVKVVSIETALAVLDAVREGKVQEKKVLTIIGPENKPLGNYRVWIGTRFRDILSEVGLTPGERDKVVAGGPMRGFAQYSLDGAVDCGTNGLMLIPESSIIPWTTEPCINCGKCIDICPVNLQAHLIGRYSEFGLFGKIEEFEIDQCIECGLCAFVCTARRPLLQLIDLAKKEILKSKKEREVPPEVGPTNPEKKGKSRKLANNNPATTLFSGLPKFTVGFAPHRRTRSSITKMNIAFILALLPVVLTSAAVQFYGKQAVSLNASFGPINSVLKAVIEGMGLNAGFLWFSGILGMALFGLGLGLLVEYLCQTFMRQPYHATNGHGALMGLLIALLMPSTIPLWVLSIAIVSAIFVGKQIFGGIGDYPMHPAMIGWLIVLLSWPQYVNPIGDVTLASAHVAVIVATIIGGIALWITGYIRIEITVGVLIGVAVFSFILRNSLGGGITEQLMTGHVMLAAFFLATDSTCSPANRLARWVYGIGTGAMIMLIRAYGIWPDAVPFAIVLMNVTYPIIDRLKPRVKKSLI